MEIEESRINSIIQNRVDSVTLKQVENAVRDYADDVILFDIIDPLERQGKDQVTTRLRQWLSTLAKVTNFEIRDVNLNLGENIAYCTSMNHIDATHVDGHKLDMWWRETTCYRRIDGAWKITHAHSSVPFNPETGQPSLSLQPRSIK